MFTCRLEIDGKDHKLSAEDGLSILELGNLLVKLSKCVEDKGCKFILGGIEFNSYDPVILADTKEAAEEFLDVHEYVATADYDDLPPELRDYADELNKILQERGVYFSATSEGSKRKIKITEINKTKVNKAYFGITTITAKIVSINGKNEAQPYILIEDYRGKTTRVIIKSSQEEELSHFYKKYYIRFRLRIKNNLESKLQLGTLLTFNVPSHKNFADSILAAKERYGDIFSNILDSSKAIRELRESKDE